MKKSFFLFVLSILMASCSTNNSKSELANSVDSVVVVEEPSVSSNDNNVTEEMRDSIIKQISHKYTIKSDEFSDDARKYYIPKSAPKYRNRNGFYCYFSTTGKNMPNSFRFVFQYEDDDWLFMENCIFNIDGENYRFIPTNPQRDNDSRIWEWFDEYITSDNIDLIRKISGAKSVKVKINGSQYYDTRTMKASEIESIRETLNDYEILGGTFYNF